MRVWWTGLQPRERGLIGIAGALTLLVVLWQFVLSPIGAAQSATEARVESKRATLSTLQQAYFDRRAQPSSMGSITGSSAVVARGEAFQSSVTRAATDAGLAIARLQGSNTNDQVGLVFEAVDPRLVFYWLDDIERRLGAEVTRLSMDPAGGGRVRVSVEIRAGGMP